MENDDKPIGLILSRRDALKLLGIGSSAFLAAFANLGTKLADTGRVPSPTPDCFIRPELEIGTHFVDDQLNRSDIRYDPLEGSVSDGIPLAIKIAVSDVSHRSCKPLQSARVDIWHCDAMGLYSGVPQRGFNTTGQKFLRGYQVTDAKGVAQFHTIYPGWYSGRAVHIHFTIRTKGTNGQNYQFTSQLFFNDKLTDSVHAQKPYSVKGKRDTLNKSDNIYRDGGYQLLLNARGNTSGGYTSAINIGLDLTDTKVGASDLFGGTP